MDLKRKLLKDCNLYLILDTQVNTYDQLFCIAQKAIAAGIDIIQLRDKSENADEILRLSEKILRLAGGKIPYIINDRPDLALEAGAAGVHLGQDDMDVAEARKIIGTEMLIGVSCQNLEHLEKADYDKADYIGFGSVFKTETKSGRKPLDLDLLGSVFKKCQIPVFAIGGINLLNYSSLRSRGVNRIAVCRSICLAENIGESVKSFKNYMGRNNNLEYASMQGAG